MTEIKTLMRPCPGNVLTDNQDPFGVVPLGPVGEIVSARLASAAGADPAWLERLLRQELERLESYASRALPHRGLPGEVSRPGRLSAKPAPAQHARAS